MVRLELLRVQKVELLIEQQVPEAGLSLLDLLVLVGECLLRRKVERVVREFQGLVRIREAGDDGTRLSHLVLENSEGLSFRRHGCHGADR